MKIDIIWPYGQTIFMRNQLNEKEVCVVLDDSSRRILAGGEYDAALADINIGLVQEVLDNFGEIRKIEQVITDRGSQFYASQTAHPATCCGVFISK